MEKKELASFLIYLYPPTYTLVANCSNRNGYEKELTNRLVYCNSSFTIKYLMDFVQELELQNPIRFEAYIFLNLDFETRRPCGPREGGRAIVGRGPAANGYLHKCCS